MDYVTYTTFRDSQDLENYTDMGDLDYYAHRSKPIPQRTSGHKGMNIHRCHLVEDFLRFFSLPSDLKQEVGMSNGVKHSLGVLMDAYNTQRWVVPYDQYPVYQKLVKKHIHPRGSMVYPAMGTHPIPSGDILLMCAPNKPYGTDTPYHLIRKWMTNNTDGLVILDIVYLFDLKSDDRLWELYETGRVILLYSLSKSLAAPNRAGFVFSPIKEIRELFKSLPRDEAKLDDAYVLLNEDQTRLNENKDFIRNQGKKLIDLLTDLSLEPLNPDSFTHPDNPSYLGFIERVSGADLIGRGKGILAVPPGVYDSDAKGVIISSLGV